MDVLRGHYPMLLLAEVARQPGHGYALVQRLNSGPAGAFDVPEGTVYPLLHQLEHEGAVSGKWQKTETGRKIKVYSITARGRRLLAKQRTQWERFVDIVKTALAAVRGEVRA